MVQTVRVQGFHPVDPFRHLTIPFAEFGPCRAASCKDWVCAEQDPCPICTDPARDRSTLCVLEEPLDVLALERTRCYNGLYHVLHGAISPIDGIGAEELKIRELLERLKGDAIQEVILATNPNLEGEATAMYIQKLVSPLVEKVTRLARGLPVGGDVEYADQVTLTRAFQGRQEF